MIRIVRDSATEQVSDLGHHGPVDVVMQRGGRRIGIEVKGWLQTPSPRAVGDVVSRLSNLVAKGELDEVWLVTPHPIEDPRGPDDARDESVLMLTVEQLRELLGA